MQIGIVGLPNAGKSTLFNALSRGKAQVEGYPFTTINPNLGRVALEDPYLKTLQSIFQASKRTPVFVEFVDIAGLVRGAHAGEGLGNQFLNHIRQVDGIVHVLRCFYNPNVAHVEGEVNPLRDVSLIEQELSFADREVVNRRKEKLIGLARSGSKESRDELECIEKVLTILDEGQSLGRIVFDSREEQWLKPLNLLTRKPVLYVLNGENDTEIQKIIKSLQGQIPEKSKILLIDAQVEADLGEMDREDVKDFLEDLGLEPSLNRLIGEAFSLLNLITYYTGNENEIRARTLKRGSTLLEAAEKVHTDIARGFIKGEVIQARDLLSFDSWQKAKTEGQIRAEGREYKLQNGDVVYIHFR